MGDKCAHHFTQIARHHGRQRIQRQVDPVIGHAALGEIIGADAFAAIARPHLRFAVRRTCIVHAGAFQIVEPCAQHLHGQFLVAVL